MYKEEVWKEEMSFWREGLSFDIFAATTNSPLYEIAERMADYQKASMATVMLAAMYSAEAPPSYLEKAAIHHLFSSYTVFHKGNSLAGWQQQVLPGKKEDLQQFIEKTYVEFEPGQVPAVRPDQKLVVKRGLLDDIVNVLRLDLLFRSDQSQPEMVLDFDGQDTVAKLINQLNVPTQLTKLTIINSGGLVVEVADDFLYENSHLKAVKLSLPQATDIGWDFLCSIQSLETVELSLPKVEWVDQCFLSHNQRLETIVLNLPQVTEISIGFLSSNQRLKTLKLNLSKVISVGEDFLSNCGELKSVDLRSLLKLESVEILEPGNVHGFMRDMTKLEHVLIDARQEEFFNELLKDKPDLLSKFMIA